MKQGLKGWSTTYFCLQLMGILLLLYIGWAAWSNLVANLSRLDIQIDMRFLRLESGFNITQKWLQHHHQSTNLNVLWVGIINTLIVSAVGIVLSTVVGILIDWLAEPTPRGNLADQLWTRFQSIQTVVSKQTAALLV